MLNHVQSRPNTTSQVTDNFIEAIGVQSCTTKIIVMIFKHNSSSFHWSTQICLVWSDRHTPHCKEDTMQFRDGILWSKCCFKSLSHLTRKQLWGSHWILMLNKRSKKASTHINIESPFKHNLSTLCYLFFQEVIKEALLWPAKCNKVVVPPVSAFWLLFSLVWQNLMLLLNRVYLTDPGEHDSYTEVTWIHEDLENKTHLGEQREWTRTVTLLASLHHWWSTDTRVHNVKLAFDSVPYMLSVGI